jgi:diaminobutyrate-2-oxoglutarate transaminase
MTDSPSIANIQFAAEPDVGEIPGPKSQHLLEEQQTYDSSAVAYPNDIALAMDEGLGATLKDVDGNIFLDFFAGIGVLNVGHSNPYVLEAVHEQTDKLVHSIDFPTEARLELIKKLDTIAPAGLQGNNRVVFGGPSGSDAIEGSIKLAKYVTGGDGLIAFRGGYHGSTSGAMSLTSKVAFKDDYTPLLPETVHLRYPSVFHQDTTAEDAVNEALYEVEKTLTDPYGGLANPAGIWVEPIQGEGGIIAPPSEFLVGLRELADTHDIPLICDEIQTGFGRTSEWWGVDHFDVTPDIMPMAKALGGAGLPLSANMYREDLDEWGPGGHVGTFRGHAPAMRAGVRAIEYIQDHDLLAHSQKVGEYIRSRLRDLQSKVPDLVDVRGKGLFIGAEFRTPDGDPRTDLVASIQEKAFKRGVIVWKAGRHGCVLRLIPPLVITHEQAEVGLDIITSVIEEEVIAGTKAR